MINDLESQIDTFASEIKALEVSTRDMKVQLQRATQVILRKALERLAKFYGDQRALIQGGHAGSAHLKHGAKQHGPPPPPGFSEHSTNSGAGGVMTMIQSVITDAKNMEAAALKAEQDAEDAYV